MVKLGPSSLGHIYREGNIQSIWRPVLGGVPGAGSTGSWETPGASLPAPCSVMAHWEPRVGHRGNIYTTEVYKYYIPCTFFAPQRANILNTYITASLLKSFLCPVSVSLLQLWSWGWRMEPTAVRGEWKWSTRENGAQRMITLELGGCICSVQTAGVWSCHWFSWRGLFWTRTWPHLAFVYFM